MCCRRRVKQVFQGGENNQLCQMTSQPVKMKAENWPSSNLEAICDFAEHFGGSNRRKSQFSNFQRVERVELARANVGYIYRFQVNRRERG